MENNIVELSDVTMRFRLTHSKIDTLKEYMIRVFKRELTYTEFNALESISLKIRRGEKLGIIGHNGAGKSTLLKIISGIYKPTSGTVRVGGTIAPLLELGAGFDPEYTGIDNIFLNGAILGQTKVYLESRLEQIVEFAELGAFIDVPLKNYSSGMRAKLGFSIAAHINPEILIVDEILGVGDEAFREKSSNKIKEMILSGHTVIMVSHRLHQIEELSDRVIWLDKGIIRDEGNPTEICSKYREYMKSK